MLRYSSVLVVAALLVGAPAQAQSFNLEFDHTNILVSDLDASASFYRDILGLEELPTPWGRNPSVRFFSVGGSRQIHVVQTNSVRAESTKAVHLAFTIRDFDGYLVFLRQAGIEYSNFAGDSIEPQIRPDGVRQIYFQDPDGNWIEVNDAAG